jgi:hypothetical protein
MTGIIAQNVGRTSGLIKAASGGTGGVWTKIKEITASADATIDFVDGTDDVVLDSTYPIYVFKFINMHPGTSAVFWTFQANAAGGSGYNETITSTTFRAVHTEAGSGQMDYIASIDQAEGTAFQNIISDGDIKTDNDSSLAGTLHLFNPSSTTFVKHFIATTNHMVNNSQSSNNYIGGYFNTTSAIDEIQFKFSSGNVDAGKIKLYGLKDSA